MTIREALNQGRKLFEDAGIGEPRLTAEVLLLHAVSLESQAGAVKTGTRKERSWLYAHSDDELRELWWIHYGRYLHQRLKGMPTQQITGHQEFYGRDFRVTPDVLIPRPETEHVIEEALKREDALKRTVEGPGATTVLDIGTGSGCIAVTLALEIKAHVFATDISAEALGVAKENARRLGAAVTFAECDLGSAFASDRFDLVVSNPPYVPLAKAAGLQKEVRDFEPSIALYGGEDGLDVYRRLIPEARRLLRAGGWLVMEVGIETAEPVQEMLREWEAVAVLADLAGLPRVVVGRKR